MQFNTEAKPDSLGFQVKYVSGGLGEFQTENWKKGLLNPRPQSQASRTLHSLAVHPRNLRSVLSTSSRWSVWWTCKRKTRGAYYSEIARAQTCTQSCRILNEMNLQFIVTADAFIISCPWKGCWPQIIFEAPPCPTIARGFQNTITGGDYVKWSEAFRSVRGQGAQRACPSLADGEPLVTLPLLCSGLAEASLDLLPCPWWK